MAALPTTVLLIILVQDLQMCAWHFFHRFSDRLFISKAEDRRSSNLVHTPAPFVGTNYLVGPLRDVQAPRTVRFHPTLAREAGVVHASC